MIERRFRGPEQSGHGGYTSARIAAFVDAATVEVTLLLPPPLDTPMRVERDGDGVRILDGDRVIAEARAAELDLDLPEPIDYGEALRIAAAHPDDPDHPFPTCFACGPARAEGDGLRLRPAPVGDGRVVAPWKPFAAERELVWAVLDCPGAYAVNPGGARGLSVLGRLTAHVDEIPAADDECVVLAWPLGGEGRRLFAGTALFRDGEPLAYARAIWFLLDPLVSSA
ncbi:MAG TPA: hypothetical protein VFM96_00330 [Gaiellaceae bacterium]|nr:hypothetical protein [Gaiellaceae bacterium]